MIDDGAMRIDDSSTTIDDGATMIDDGSMMIRDRTTMKGTRRRWIEGEARRTTKERDEDETTEGIVKSLFELLALYLQPRRREKLLLCGN
jgi:hypothetical protein